MKIFTKYNIGDAVKYHDDMIDPEEKFWIESITLKPDVDTSEIVTYYLIRNRFYEYFRATELELSKTI